MALNRNPAQAASTLVKLRANQASLELKAKQLAARKSDVEARADDLSRKLRRNIDTREKILLGALVKMVGLDRYTLSRQNENETATIGQQDGIVMTTYDLDLLVGSLLQLSDALGDASLDEVADLRDDGQRFRASSSRSISRKMLIDLNSEAQREGTRGWEGCEQFPSS